MRVNRYYSVTIDAKQTEFNLCRGCYRMYVAAGHLLEYMGPGEPGAKCDGVIICTERNTERKK